MDLDRGRRRRQQAEVRRAQTEPEQGDPPPVRRQIGDNGDAQQDKGGDGRGETGETGVTKQGEPPAMCLAASEARLAVAPPVLRQRPPRLRERTPLPPPPKS